MQLFVEDDGDTPRLWYVVVLFPGETEAMLKTEIEELHKTCGQQVGGKKTRGKKKKKKSFDERGYLSKLRIYFI